MHAYNFGTGEPSGVDPGYDLSETLLPIVYTLVLAGCKRQITQRITGSIGHFFGVRRGTRFLPLPVQIKTPSAAPWDRLFSTDEGSATAPPCGLWCAALLAHPSARGHEKSPAPTLLRSSSL